MSKKKLLYEFDPVIYPRKLWVCIGIDEEYTNSKFHGEGGTKLEEWKPLSKTNMAGSKILSNFADGVFAIGRTKTGGRYLKLLKTRMVSEPDEKSLLPLIS